MKKHPWKIIGGVAIVLFAASFYFANQSGEGANEGVVIGENAKGNLESSIVLTEYSDFQCPACGQFFPVIKEVLDEFGEDIRFEYKHFPLISIHRFAVPAAKAAEAAGQQGKFFEMHDKLFENQTAWSNSASPNAFFIQYAEELELDIDLFKRHMKSSLIDDKIQAEFSEARERGLSGTPSFFLNGNRLQFETFQDFRDAIDVAVNGAPEQAEGGPEAAPASTGSDIKFGI